MSDDKIEEGIKAGATSLFSSLPSEIRWVIGIKIAYFLFLGGLMALDKLPGVFEKGCWDLQFQQDRVFKLNKCNGDVFELDS